MAQAYNLNSQEVKAGITKVQGHPQLHRGQDEIHEALSHKKQTADFKNEDFLF